jgi:hypothetical protein
MRVEYAVLPSTDPGLAVLQGGAPAEVDLALGRTNAVLVRRELDFNGVVIPNTTRIVMEFVADFQVDFVFDTQVTAGLPPNLVRRSDAAAGGILNVNPEQVRSAIVTLSARTRQHETRFGFVPRADPATEPLTSYKVAPAAPGAARVRTIRSEILMPNVAYRIQ